MRKMTREILESTTETIVTEYLRLYEIEDKYDELIKAVSPIPEGVSAQERIVSILKSQETTLNEFIEIEGLEKLPAMAASILVCDAQALMRRVAEGRIPVFSLSADEEPKICIMSLVSLVTEAEEGDADALKMNQRAFVVALVARQLNNTGMVYQENLNEESAVSDVRISGDDYVIFKGFGESELTKSE